MQLQQFLVNADMVVLQRTLKLMLLVTALGLLCFMTGCVGGSARDLYYGARAIENPGIEGDGSVVVSVDRSDELRDAILQARRVQLADAEK